MMQYFLLRRECNSMVLVPSPADVWFAAAAASPEVSLEFVFPVHATTGTLQLPSCRLPEMLIKPEFAAAAVSSAGAVIRPAAHQSCKVFGRLAGAFLTGASTGGERVFQLDMVADKPTRVSS
ncbi:hypothetical protein ACJZ2D_016565 [Fusarium nematophilum]